MSGRREYDMTFRLGAEVGSTYNAAFKKATEQITAMQKELRDLNTTQSQISGYQKQQASVEATRQKLAVLKQQYDNIQKEIRETDGYSSELENKLIDKKAAIEKTTAALKANEEKLGKMGQALKDAGVDTNNLAEESKGLEKRINGVKEAQEAAAEEAKRHSKTSVSAIEEIQGAMVAAGIAKLYKGIAEEVAACTKASIEYESALTGVYKTVDGTPEQLEAIDREIKQMATEIPATTTEIAAVAESAGQLGIATEDVMAFTRVMLDLGESTNLSADEAASSLAKFANITGTAADDYERLGSVIVDLGNNFATTEADIVAMSTRLASAGTLAGLSEAEIMALAAAMSSVGIEAEAGGTAMTQTLSAIEKAVSERGKDLQEFARISGMSADEFAQKWETAPIEAIQAFIEGIGKLDEQGESAVLVLDELGLSGVRQSNMIKSLGLASDKLADSVITANEAWEENTALSEEANKRYSTTESRLKMLKNSYTNLQIAIGDVYNPALNNAIDLGQDMLDGLTEFVEENPETVKAITAAAVGVGTFSLALGGYVIASKAAAIATKALTAAMKANPYLLAGAAIIGVVAAIGSLAVMSAETNEDVRRLKDEVKDLAEANEALRLSAKEGLDDIEEETELATRHADELNDLMEIENKSAGEKERMAVLVNELNELYPDLNLEYDKEKDVLIGINDEIVKNTDFIRDNIKAKEEQLKADLYLEQWRAWNDEVIEAEKTARETKSVVEKYGKQIDGAQGNWLNLINPVYYYEQNKLFEKRDEAILNNLDAENYVKEAYEQRDSFLDLYVYKASGAIETVKVLKKAIEELPEVEGAFDFAGAKALFENFAATASEEDIKAAVEIMKGYGFKFGESYAEGIAESEQITAEEIANIANISVDTVIEICGLNTPSPVYFEMARDNLLAYVKGLREYSGLVNSETVSVAKKMLPKAQFSIEGSGGGSEFTVNADGYAVGTDYATRGWHMVGEKGPELAYFGGGEKVYTAEETKAILQGNYTAVSYMPIMGKALAAYEAKADRGKSVSVVINPVFNVEGGNADNIESKLREYSDIIVMRAMEALEEAGIDAKRGAYA